MSKKKEHITEPNRGATTGQDRLLSVASAVLSRGWDAFRYSSLYITVSAVVEVGIAMALLGIPLNPAPLVVGLVTFAVYTNDRLADAETDAFSNPEKAAFIERYGHVLRPLADVAYGLAVMTAIVGGPLALALTLLPGVFWVFYASGWLDRFGTSLSRLKSLFVVNTTIVAVAWAVVLTLLPLAFDGGPVTVTAAFVFAYFFFRVFTFVELSNIPDIEGDRLIGVDTIPTVFGIDGTRRALYLVNGLTVVVVVVTLRAGHLSSTVALPLVLGIAYSLCVTALVGRWQNIAALIQTAEAEYFLTYALLTVLLSV
jgi:4-hydroxybenzoate polyprenyltransferase